MSMRFDASPLIAGAFHLGVRGLGVRKWDIPALGTNGPSFLYNDIDNTISDEAEYRVLILTKPSQGVLFVNEDGSASFDATGLPDDAYSGTQRVYRDGVSQGDTTYTFLVGDVDPPGLKTVRLTTTPNPITGLAPTVIREANNKVALLTTANPVTGLAPVVFRGLPPPYIPVPESRLWRVVADPRFIIYKTGVDVVYTKDPNARKAYGVDLAAECINGVTLVSFTISAIAGVAIDVAKGGQMPVNGTKAAAWFQGGVPDGDNYATFHYVLSDGSEDDATIRFNIVEK